MTERNNNSEKRWLTWIVRVVVPALVAALWVAQWASLSGQIEDLRCEVREMRADMKGELAAQRETDRGHDARLARLDAALGFLGEDGRRDYSHHDSGGEGGKQNERQEAPGEAGQD